MGRGGGGLRCCIFYIPPVEASSDQCSAVPALLSIVPPPSLPSLLLPPPPLQGLPTQYSTYLSTRPPSSLLPCRAYPRSTPPTSLPAPPPSSSSSPAGPTHTVLHLPLYPPPLPPPPLQGLPTQYSTYLSTRPPSFEQDAIRTLIRLLDEDAAANKEEAAPGFRLHIAHLSDAGCLPLIKVSTGSGRPWGNEGEGAAGRTGRAELWLLSLRSG